MLRSLFSHKATGYVQILICVSALLYAGCSALTYNHILRDIVYHPVAVCQRLTQGYVVTEIKGIPRCVRKADAVVWEKSSTGIGIALFVFLLVLFVPAFVSGKLDLSGWNKKSGQGDVAR